jgi:hypothetical protein
MKRLPLTACALAGALALSGCAHLPFFSKTPRLKPPKESSKIATDTENELFDRWVAKRSNELVSQGKSPEEARAQAIAEFKEKFWATAVAQRH